MPDDEIVLQHTRNWVRDVIIGLNFCPFAKREFNRDSIRYIVNNANNTEAQLRNLIDECLQLDNNSDCETTLIIFPSYLDDFEWFLDFIALADELMHQQGYQGVYQLAHFHPQYQFEGTDLDDAANYTNRSPYPVLHLLREASIENAIKNYPHAESIPQTNIELARQKGKIAMQALLDASLT